MEMTDYQECPFLLERSLLAIAQALIDVRKGRIVIRLNGDCQAYEVDANIEGQPSEEVCKMAKERCLHPTKAFKRSRLTKPKEPDVEICDNEHMEIPS